MNLEGLQQKINNYNKKHSTNWAILLENTGSVYIVDKEDNAKSPKWWPNNLTAETINKAYELVPSVKEKRDYYVEIGDVGKKEVRVAFLTKSQFLTLKALIDHELKYGK